ncbi:tetratricopeptide repeat protein, partial [Microbispora sp. NPDC046973]|uniref:tetratricopeptide repeat protein n=1 Tax=Microbispora sp. NPDC046973 TaxID=3155022 RepID=UPI003410D2DC
HYDEALAILRTLVAADPAKYGPAFLAWVHDPVGWQLRGAGQNVKAEALANEAVAIARGLGDRYQEANAQLNIGAALWGIAERRAEAFAHYDEALAILRTLVAADPAKYGPTFLAWVHDPIGWQLRGAGQNAKADALAAEAAAMAGGTPLGARDSGGA